MGDERGQIAVARAIGGEQYQAKPIVELEFTTDDERQLAFLRLDMRAHCTGERALVGDCQCGVVKLVRSRNELLRMRSSAQESEIGEAMQLGVGHETR